MDSDDSHRIEFPCDYPIKIIGVYHEQFKEVVCDLTTAHAPGFTEKNVAIRMSGKGNYCSVKITITATGEAQLKRLHKALMSHDMVKMVI
ncbi:MAG: DUF493 domain-containing protein [Pseudomonadales bacterium]|nr:DUF493 domain-containing protein [Pseudomonadales bacterium]